MFIAKKEGKVDCVSNKIMLMTSGNESDNKKISFFFSFHGVKLNKKKNYLKFAFKNHPSAA